MEKSDVAGYGIKSCGSPQETHCHGHSDVPKRPGPGFEGKICKQRESNLERICY